MSDMRGAGRIWLALDVDSRAAAEGIMADLPGHHDFKVGMQLFFRLGPDIVRGWIGDGQRIFLDLKLYDIPHTVGEAVRAVDALGVELLTIHIVGGAAMLSAAREAARTTRLIGVTVLTSASPDTLRSVGLFEPLPTVVGRLVRLAESSGLDGVVVSGDEVGAVAGTWPGSRRVVPGIRFGTAPPNDQARVIAPGEARRRGTTDLVVGRAVTAAPDRRAAYQQLLALWEEGDITYGGRNP